MPSGLPDPLVELCPLCYTVLNDKLWATMGECSHSYHLKCLLSAFISEDAHNSEYVICPACRLAVVSGSPASERRLRKKLNIADPPPDLQHIHAPKWKLKSQQQATGHRPQTSGPVLPPRPRPRFPGTGSRQRFFKQVVGSHKGDGMSTRLPPGPVKLQPRPPISVSELMGRPRSLPRSMGRVQASTHPRTLTNSRSHLRHPFLQQAGHGLGHGLGHESPWADPGLGSADEEPAWSDLNLSTEASAGTGITRPRVRPRNLFKIHRPIKRRNYLARHAAIVRRQRAAAHFDSSLDP